MGRAEYHTCCVALSEEDVPALDAMQAARRDISFSTFRRHVNYLATATALDYGTRRGDLKLQGDYHVNFYRSTYKCAPCFFMIHSAIEYIFIRKEDLCLLKDCPAPESIDS